MMNILKPHMSYENIDRLYIAYAGKDQRHWEKSFPVMYDKYPLKISGNRKESSFKLFALAEIMRINNHDESYKRLSLDYLRQSNEFAVMQYQMALNLGKPTSFVLKGHHFEVMAPEKSHFTTVDYWYKDLAVSLILRDETSVEALLKYQPKDTIRNGELSSFDTALCEFIKGIFDESADIRSLFLSLVNIVANGNEIGSRQGYIDLCIMPTIMAWAALIENNMEKFEQSVLDATKYLYSYYHKSEWEGDPYGWFPPLLIAAAVFAHDQYSYSLKHDNPYIPKWIVEKDFL